MDFEDLEEKAKDPAVRLLILCNPHNPVGRVWTREELEKLGDICLRNGIVVLSDEIHCDLVYPGKTYTPFAQLADAYASRSITFIAPSKTFNVAGLHHSHAIIPNKRIRDVYKQMLKRRHIDLMNPF